jgi:alpha-D-xyloside xylohydrolase
VTIPGAEARNVYLPAGADWYDFQTNQRYHGGRTINASAPLAHMPVFARAGAIVPLGPIVQYADEAPNAPLEIRIYRGADGVFTLYDDAGDGYGYEHGQRATIDIGWNDTSGELRFARRRGAYPGMPRTREFNVVFVGPDGASAPQTVTYRGGALRVSPH